MPDINKLTCTVDKNQIDWNTFELETCDRCELCKVRRNVVPPKIVPGSKILFIAEAPGETEDLFGTEPLIGECGVLFNQCLLEVGLNRDDVSIANVINCHPPKNRDPFKEEIKACYDILEHTIKTVNPEIIVPLGNIALKRILRTSGITKHNGVVSTHKNYPDVKIIPVVHPSYALRDPSNLDTFKFGLQRVYKALHNKLEVKTSKVTYVDTYEKFDAMIKDLSSSKHFALDIETSSLRDWLNGYIICISFANKIGESYVLPWIIGDEQFYEFCRTEVIPVKKRDVVSDLKKFCGENKLNHPTYFWKGTDVKSRLKELLANPNIIKILHNYAFDEKFLERANLKLENSIADTMIIHHMLDEKRKTHNLNHLTRVFTEYGDYWTGLEGLTISVPSKNKFDSYAIIPMDKLIPYAGTDSDVTLQLYRIFIPKLVKEDKDFIKLFNTFLMPLTKMLMQTEKNGITVDLEYLKKCDEILSNHISELDKKLNNFAPGVNFNSPKQLAKLLFDDLKLPALKKTPKGFPSTDEEALNGLVNLHEFPKLLLDRRKKMKLLNTYVRGTKNNMWDDGRVHSNFHICGTETGRLSSSNVNMQNLPRPVAELLAMGINIRDLFVSPNRDTHYLVEVDYSQAELRLIAEYSRDKNLYRAFKDGKDPHAMFGVHVFHPNEVSKLNAGLIDARDVVTDEERQKAKTANFALAYGKWYPNFARENNLPEEEAKYIYDTYWQTYSDYGEWKDEILQEAYKNLYFKSYFGRRRRMKKLLSRDRYTRSEAEREGINFVIQSQASDYTLDSTLKVCAKAKELGYDFKTVSFVHDSAVYEVSKNDIQGFLSLLKSIMENVEGVSLTMEIEVKIGYRLGSLKKWDLINGVWQEKIKKSA